MRVAQSRKTRTAERRAVFIAPPFFAAPAYPAYASPYMPVAHPPPYAAPPPAQAQTADVSYPVKAEPVPSPEPQFGTQSSEVGDDSPQNARPHHDLDVLFNDKTRIPFFDIFPRGRSTSSCGVVNI